MKKANKVQNVSDSNGLKLGATYIVNAIIDWQTGIFYTLINVDGVFDSVDFEGV